MVAVGVAVGLVVAVGVGVGVDMSDQPTVSLSEAARMLSCDNRGEPSVSPSARRIIDAGRIARVEWLEKENAARRAARLEAERNGPCGPHPKGDR